MKRCTKCGRVLPQDMFWRRARSVDGLQYRCKECERPGYEAREAARYRARKAENARLWRERHPDKVRAYNASRQAERNAHNYAARYRRRVAKHLAEPDTVAALFASLNGGTSGTTDARALVAYWETAGIANTCHRGCGRGWRQIIHAVPLYDGGAHDVTNLVPVCGRCG